MVKKRLTKIEIKERIRVKDVLDVRLIRKMAIVAIKDDKRLLKELSKH